MVWEDASVRRWPARVVALHRGAAVALALVSGVFGHLVAPPGGALAGVVVGVGYYAIFTRRFRKRRALLAAPMPEDHQRILEARVPFYQKLDPEGRGRFEDDVRIFLAEQTITGARDAAVSDEARLLIAASAAMLSHGLPSWEWPRVRDIVVYPRAFDDRYDIDAAGGHVAGQVSLSGPILFSRRDLELGFRHASDGHNVGLHELAHVMDMQDGAADGVPADLPWVSTAPWVKVVASRLRALRRRRGGSFLRDYAGTNEAELFAVAVEVFFEQPARLAARDPELFEMLRDYFNQDPRHPGAPL